VAAPAWSPPIDCGQNGANGGRAFTRTAGGDTLVQMDDGPATSHLDVYARSPHRVGPSSNSTDELLRLGCLDYGTHDPARIAAADRMLTSDSALARATVWTMAAVGDVNALAAALTADPEAVNREGGPFAWPPLLYLAYSRIASDHPGHDAVGAARVLLDRGADPNAGFLWDGCVPPFTALTGAIGGGERGEPPHAHWRALAEVLLAAGADANDHQAIYNRGLGDAPRDDTDVLELLYAHGLGTGDGGVWARRLGDALPSPADLVAEVLQHAAEHGLERRVRLALAHGADPDRPARHPIYAGRTPLSGALRNGNLTIAAGLEAAGADATGIGEVDRVIARAMAGDPSAGDDPALVLAAVERDPAAIVRAATFGRAPAVRLLVALGWDVDARERGTALHEAAWHGDRELVEELLALGADPTIRDAAFDGTPAAWAHHGGHPDLAARLTRAEPPPRTR
jgi:hypothetical protein